MTRLHKYLRIVFVLAFIQELLLPTCAAEGEEEPRLPDNLKGYGLKWPQPRGWIDMLKMDVSEEAEMKAKLLIKEAQKYKELVKKAEETGKLTDADLYGKLAVLNYWKASDMGSDIATAALDLIFDYAFLRQTKNPILGSSFTSRQCCDPYERKRDAHLPVEKRKDLGFEAIRKERRWAIDFWKLEVSLDDGKPIDLELLSSPSAEGVPVRVRARREIEVKEAEHTAVPEWEATIEGESQDTDPLLGGGTIARDSTNPADENLISRLMEGLRHRKTGTEAR